MTKVFIPLDTDGVSYSCEQPNVVMATKPMSSLRAVGMLNPHPFLNFQNLNYGVNIVKNLHIFFKFGVLPVFIPPRKCNILRLNLFFLLLVAL